MEKFNNPEMEAVKLKKDEAEAVVGGINGELVVGVTGESKPMYDAAAPAAPAAGDPELMCSSPVANKIV